MRVAVGQFDTLSREMLRFAAQIGATGIQMQSPAILGENRWEEDDLRSLVELTESYGLKFEAIENVPRSFYEKVMLGSEGRDEQLGRLCETIRRIGRAGIPILGYNFMPSSVWRTDRAWVGRGGALTTKFDLQKVSQAATSAELLPFVPRFVQEQSPVSVHGGTDVLVSADEMWDNYAYFLRAVLPVAEESGVTLALHPDDPPVPLLGGVARIFCTPADFKRAWELSNGSAAWALDLCLGCCSEMSGGAQNAKELIEFFGPKGRIAYVHFRDVQGTVPDFAECFLGEGNFDPAEMISLLAANGFSGFLLDDHVPSMDDDSSWNHRGRAHAIGYMQGLVRMLDWRSRKT